jgi:dUTP pyrophosphatase
MVTPFVKIKLLNGAARAPEYKSRLAAGADCYACIYKGDGYGTILLPGERKLISLGFAAAVPRGWEMQLRPRSGMALKEGITLLNSPGTIDADFVGEIKALVINHGNESAMISHGDRICQAVIAPVGEAVFNLVDELDDTERGEGGFGHSGNR